MIFIVVLLVSALLGAVFWRRLFRVNGDDRRHRAVSPEQARWEQETNELIDGGLGSGSLLVSLFAGLWYAIRRIRGHPEDPRRGGRPV